MKHERAGLILLSYLIGFTTAFIAYGMQQTDSSSMPTIATTDVTSQVATLAVTSNDMLSDVPSELYESEEGLMMQRSGETRLIAAGASFAPELGDDAYETIEAQALSRDGRYAFFCMTTPSVSDSCFPYVYDWEASGLRPVTVGGELGNFAVGDVNAAWSSDGYLQVGRYLSVSSDTPWALQ
jgi:hypothetical protein